jgi:hypothetical protein
MVFTRDKRRTSSDVERRRGIFLRKVPSKNQLTSPVSPYDELPIIQDLVEQLTPNPGSRKQRTEEDHPQQSQERQQSNDQHKKTNQSDGRQQRDQPEPTQIDHHLPGYNSAHDVPTTISIPSHPTYSEDSDLTLDGVWKRKGESSSSPKISIVRTLTPHPSFEEILPTPFDFHHDEEIWPSDEEDNGPTRPTRKNTTTTSSSTYFWTNGSIHVWNLEGDDDAKKKNQSVVTEKQDKKKKRCSKGRQRCLV